MRSVTGSRDLVRPSVRSGLFPLGRVSFVWGTLLGVYNSSRMQNLVLFLSLVALGACSPDSGASKRPASGESMSSAEADGDSSSPQKPLPKVPKLSEEDKKKVRVRYSRGGTSSPCGPRFVLTVFEDGVVYCEGEEHYLGEGDCPPKWGGEASMSGSKSKEWIDFVRDQIKDKQLGSSGCDGAWSTFRVFSGVDIEAKTKNLSCEDEGEVEERLVSSAKEIWREYCLPFRPDDLPSDE